MKKALFPIICALVILVLCACNIDPKNEISEDGYWLIDGIKTEVRVEPDQDTNNVQGLEFFQKDDGTYTVAIGSAERLSKIVIPSKYLGKAVTEIYDRGFEEAANLKEIIIPDTVQAIGENAFTNCSNLSNIELGNNVTSIGKYAFENCLGLTSVTIPSSVQRIDHYAFTGCYKLVEVINKSSIYIMKGAEDNGCIGNFALEVHMGESKIDNKDGYLFYTYDGSSYLLGYVGNETALVLPDHYNSNRYEIYNYAFYGLDSLTGVVIGNGVTAIGVDAFAACINLASITIAANDTKICEWAFSYCENLINVTIKGEATTIEDNSFFNCPIKDATLPTSAIFYIPTSNLETVVFTSGQTVPGGALDRCTNVVSVTIPDSVTSIEEWAFYGCESLTSVTIGNGVTSIGNSAFYGCTSLTGVTIPDSVTSISDSAFSGCTSLYSVAIESTSISLGSGVFYMCPIKTATIPTDAISAIPHSALTTVIITYGTTIDAYAFSNCENLTSITISDGVTNIGDYAFYCCTNLESVIIPDSVTHISDYALSSCDSLTSIKYSGTREQWELIEKDFYWDYYSFNYTITYN